MWNTIQAIGIQIARVVFFTTFAIAILLLALVLIFGDRLVTMARNVKDAAIVARGFARLAAVFVVEAIKESPFGRRS